MKICYCDLCKHVIPEQSVKYSVSIKRIGCAERIGEDICLDCYKIISNAIEECEKRGKDNERTSL